MRRLALLVVLACAAALGGAAAPAGACACGVALDATITGQRALVVQAGDRETVLVSFDLQPEAGKRGAVVFPVPARPTVEAYAGDDDPFAYLARVTTPPPPDTGDGDGATAGAPSGGGVDVYGQEEVGGYDVARLGADDPNALARWLAENGYSVPDGADPILTEYVRDGWSYVAVKLAEDSPAGALKPLEISFESDEAVYPMRLERLSSTPISLTLWVAGDQRVSVDPLAATFGEEISRLDDPPPGPLAGVLGDARYLTRLEVSGLDPSTIEDDFRAVPAADLQAPFDERFPGDGARRDDPNDALLTVVTIAAVLGALGILALLALLVRGRLVARRDR